MSSIIADAAKAAHIGTDRGLQEVLDFLVTQEQLSVTFLGAAIERAGGTPSAAFLPVLRNAGTTEFHHVEALQIGGVAPLRATPPNRQRGRRSRVGVRRRGLRPVDRVSRARYRVGRREPRQRSIGRGATTVEPMRRLVGVDEQAILA
jgi:hypothetical protein